MNRGRSPEDAGGQTFSFPESIRYPWDMLRIKRVYEERSDTDGLRILIDRLWPRGISKERAGIDLWMKDIAPNDELRRWFGHDPERWDEFRTRYQRELAEKQDLIATLRKMDREGTVTLIYAAKDMDHNNAVVLKEAIETG
jgi:uncharacterized protein YeaO (DUF488 family)